MDTDREDDAQQHRRARPQDDAPLALMHRQRSACERDDDRVVARQQDVAPDGPGDLRTTHAVITSVPLQPQGNPVLGRQRR